MDESGKSPLVGTFRGKVSVGDTDFAVIIEVKTPVAGVDGVDKAIVGLAGDHLRHAVRGPSEAVFVEEIKVVPDNEPIPDRLDEPIEIPDWLPGVRILSIKPL